MVKSVTYAWDGRPLPAVEVVRDGGLHGNNPTLRLVSLDCLRCPRKHAAKRDEGRWSPIRGLTALLSRHEVSVSGHERRTGDGEHNKDAETTCVTTPAFVQPRGIAALLPDLGVVAHRAGPMGCGAHHARVATAEPPD